MAKILVIEDEADLQQVLQYNLHQAGHEVLSALRGQEGLQLARQHPPDLVLLDLMLPDLTGTEVCKALKRDPATQHVPVIMVTARGEEVDRIVGFELGADDYVVKPFSVRELLLRVQAVLRRPAAGSGAPGSGSARAAVDAEAGGPAIEFGCLRIDRDAHRVWVEEREVRLTALEMKLLLTLIKGKNRVYTRSMLLDDVWNIETVRGVGYRFVQSPEEAPR